MKKLELYYCEHEFKIYSDKALELYKEAMSLEEADEIMLEEKGRDIIEAFESVEVREDLTEKEIEEKANEMLKKYKRKIYHISNDLYEECIYTAELNYYDEYDEIDSGYTIAATTNAVENI